MNTGKRHVSDPEFVQDVVVAVVVVVRGTLIDEHKDSRLTDGRNS